MSTEREGGGTLRFDNDRLLPVGPIVKAAEREQWHGFEALREQADLRIERELRQAVAAAVDELHRDSGERLAARLHELLQAFDAAALHMERAAMELAQAIARSIVCEAGPGAFLARAAEHLNALVPQGDALRVRIPASAAGAFEPVADSLRRASARHVDVIIDESLTDPLALIVQTREGEIDLGAQTQLRRLADAAVKAVLAADDEEAASAAGAPEQGAG